MSFSLPQHKINIMRKILYPIITMLILSCNKNSFVNINRLDVNTQAKVVPGVNTIGAVTFIKA